MCERKEKGWGQRVGDRERGEARRATEGEGVRASGAGGRPAQALVGCAWPAGGLRSALAGPVGLAGA